MTADAPSVQMLGKETMTITASGSFTIDLRPRPSPEEAGVHIGRLFFDKTFTGDLHAQSRGEMLSFRTAAEDSAGYVALEVVTGTLGGRRGSFAFLQSGLMNRGNPSQIYTVIPDSGTDELTGLSGELTLHREGGQHAYHFVYDLPHHEQETAS